jgi:hypothetical protein
MLHEYHVIYSVRYYACFHVSAVVLGTYYPWILGHYYFSVMKRLVSPICVTYTTTGQFIQLRGSIKGSPILCVVSYIPTVATADAVGILCEFSFLLGTVVKSVLTSVEALNSGG